MYFAVDFMKVICSGMSRIVLFLTSLTLLVSCEKTGIVHFADHKRLSESALEQLHKEYNDQQFDKIYDASSSILKKQLDRQTFIAGFREAFSQLGPITESSDIATACFPLEVRTVRHTKYERGEAGEMIIWSIEGGQAQLASFKLTPGKPAAPTEPHRGCDGTSAVVVLPGS
ncbi:MAG: hypothetical protein HEQ39_14020 [Rhizobacter sp.]